MVVFRSDTLIFPHAPALAGEISFVVADEAAHGIAVFEGGREKKEARLSVSIAPAPSRAAASPVDPKHIPNVNKREHAVGAIVEDPRGRFCGAPSLSSRV
jgi:hypothetical protein